MTTKTMKVLSEDGCLEVPRHLRLALDTMLAVYSMVPLALLGTLYSFVWRARGELGRWPIPMFPDPKSLTFRGAETHFESVFWLGAFTMCCLVPWVLTLFLRRQFEIQKLWCALLAFPWIAVVLVIAFDPGDYVAWYLD